MEIAEILCRASRLGASDVHLNPGRPASVRIHGDMRALDPDGPELDPQLLESMLFGLLTADRAEQLRQHLDMDLSHTQVIDNESVRFRVNLHRQRGGWGCVMRIISAKIPSFEDITLEPAIQKLAHLPRGLVLLTGPTGSGKSTTLATLIQAINNRYRRHILTIEDPIEYLYRADKCEVTQRELGSHTEQFSVALKSALRADPDVILIGEMRDLETIQLALTASETGHLVFSTLHTCDASQSVDRIIDVFPAAQQQMVRAQLANVLQGIITQVLLPRSDGDGRVAAREILLMNAAVRTLIREEKSHQLYSQLSAGLQQGMQPLEYALAQLVRQNVVETEIAAAVANRESVFRSYLGR